MPTFLGFMCALWLAAGLLALVNVVATNPANVLQQQYLAIHSILAAVLLSFGVLFAFASWAAARLSTEPEPVRKPETPPHDNVDKLIAKHARGYAGHFR